jgi:AraC-like DNA-binding protein
MIDPLAEVVTLLEPSARYAKLIVGAGPWHIRRSDAGQPFYGVVLEGACRLAIDGHETIELHSGDFILVPEAYGVAMSSIMPTPAGSPETVPIALGAGEFRIGDQDGPVDLRMLAGHCDFGSPDADMLVSLLPQVVHVCGEARLTTLVQLIRDEFRDRRPARDVILTHLLEVLLIEALRSMATTPVSSGLVRGLADERLVVTLRRMHESPTRAWTVAQLAQEAALSRSAFFERFHRAVGLAPMAYLLNWRMALAKNMLR